MVRIMIGAPKVSERPPAHPLRDCANARLRDLFAGLQIAQSRNRAIAQWMGGGLIYIELNVFTKLRGLLYATAFIALWSWVAVSIRPLDERIGMTIPTWIRPLG